VGLAPWHGWDEKLPAEVLRLVAERRAALVAGTLALEIPAEEPRAE
jgi:hypothetical protein